MRPGVLYVCYGNACRSIMAEALTRHVWGARLFAASAGINPFGRVSDHSMTVLRELGVSTKGLYSKGFWDVNIAHFHLIVNLTNWPLTAMLPNEFAAQIIKLPTKDPFGRHIEQYRKTRDFLNSWIYNTLPKYLDREFARF